MLSNVQSRLPLVQLGSIPTCPGPGYQIEELSSSLSTSPPQEAIESDELLLSLLFSRLESQKCLGWERHLRLLSPSNNSVPVLDHPCGEEIFS